MKVLVTGASGMLGRATAMALAARGDEVTVLQRGTAGLDLREVRGDVADTEVVGAAMRGQDAVVHLAARVGVVGTAAEFEHANVTGTDHGARTAAPRPVSAGSSTSPPPRSPTPASRWWVRVRARRPDHAIGHYARTKAAPSSSRWPPADDLAVVAIRPHLVWGPGDTQLIGRIVARARAGRLALVDDGAALIDTTYVDNAVDALVAALDRAEDDARARPRVRGLQRQPRTVAELVTRICRAAGLPHRTGRCRCRVAWAGGAVAERVWARLERTDDPPMTSFLAEQLATAHWFDQRETRRRSAGTPRVGLEEASGSPPASRSWVSSTWSSAASRPSSRRTRSTTSRRCPASRRCTRTSCSSSPPTRARSSSARPTLWNQLGGDDRAGEGVVVGILDTGIWPEHPSFSDPAPSGHTFPAPPAARTRASSGSDQPRRRALRPATTSSSALSASWHLRRVRPSAAAGEFTSARDDDGHGTHTASTAAGNAGVDASFLGAQPRHRLRDRARRPRDRLQGLRAVWLLQLRLRRRDQPGGRCTASTS
jgi:2-alkyl-3-oxoalkanoate reductase